MGTTDIQTSLETHDFLYDTCTSKIPGYQDTRYQHSTSKKKKNQWLLLHTEVNKFINSEDCIPNFGSFISMKPHFSFPLDIIKLILRSTYKSSFHYFTNIT